MSERGSPALRRRRLGMELRRLRENLNMTGDEVAERLEWSTAKVSRIENAKTLAGPADVEALIRLYKVDEALQDVLVALRRDASRKGWWERYRNSIPDEYITLMGMEAEATLMQNWEPQIVPGLLQTEEYVRSLVQANQHAGQVPPGRLQELIDIRMERQRTLLHVPDPLTHVSVFHESVLRNQYGDARVMRDQLAHLIEVSRLEHVEMRILPQDVPPPVSTGSFVHLKFPDFPDVVYVEALLGGRFVEDAELVYAYELAFGHLVERALDEMASQELIKKTIKYWSE
ncbi:helix-turn-helix domain-containing protein [Streptosporangium lutulentum]|uniref:Transcriptional regulator with XRE-family HTH domain n=1 Tax=Streptosporangium lutulentum TaxID=1461250 RepID=A0ABT9QKT7_9ACTN|nr:helix-turn-helix transcriptional regulator [Streptosporangium lutulentum]MDP9847342.1 transcriptional regulator with XRE-family HTH domain [Streptosporangium lutulentum]